MDRRMAQALDRYLTSAPEWEPTLIDATNYSDWHDDDCVNERYCEVCKRAVGWIQFENHGEVVMQYSFWQIDEDGERVWCESCYDAEHYEPEYETYYGLPDND